MSGYGKGFIVISVCFLAPRRFFSPSPSNQLNRGGRGLNNFHIDHESLLLCSDVNVSCRYYAVSWIVGDNVI